MSKYYPGEHPLRLQTKSGWHKMGWTLKPGAASYDIVRSEWGKFDLYNYDQVEPLSGHKARERREDFMFAYLRKMTESLASQWSSEHPHASDDEIQDKAICCTLDWYQDVFFFKDITEDVFQQRLRPQLVFTFELQALKCMGKTYEQYAWNDL